MHHKAEWIKDEIIDFLGDLHNNSLTSGEEGDPFASEPAWAEPLVAFAGGADPIFESYKEYVNENHWTPAEIFGKTFPGQKISSSELTIISWILPQTDAVKVDHRQADWIPPERWIRARIFGEKVNDRLRSHVAETLIRAGISAVAPSLHPDFRRMASDKYTITSIVVRTPRRSRRRPGHIRTVRRFDHRQGESHAHRIRGGQARDRTHKKAVFRTPGLLSVLFTKRLRRLHFPMSGRCVEQIRA